MRAKLNVEVAVKIESQLRNEALVSNIKKELHCKIVQLGDKLTEFTSEELTQHIDSIRICEFDKINNNIDVKEDKCDDVREITIDQDLLKIYFFRLNTVGPQAESIGEENEDTLAATFTMLPSSFYDGLLENLIFDSNIKENLLQYAQTMLYYSRNGVDPTVVSCSRVLLLHGPPGTGKTSLCKALAQKLSIRLSSFFSQAMLIEINTHSLFSKYFSESGKLVSKMFGKIRELAEETKTLLCVLVDEVESLTYSRETANSGSEPTDALRVVNAVLTHMDLLKQFPNVLIFTTSNISKAIDKAFLDRADFRIFIPNPSPFGIYTIYHSCITELIRKGLIVGPCPEKIANKYIFENYDGNGVLEGTKELIELAKESFGLSGRTLRKVPLRVHATLIRPETNATLIHFLQSMFLAVKTIKDEAKIFSSEEHIHLQ